MRHRHSSRLQHLTALLVLAAWAGGAGADTMYKCVDPNGKIGYSNQPCPGNSNASKTFKVADAQDAGVLAKSESERKARLKQVNEAREKAAADRWEKENPEAAKDQAAKDALRKAGIDPDRFVYGNNDPKPPQFDKETAARIRAANCARRNIQC